MSLMPTQEEVMKSLKRQVDDLKRENKLLKAIISGMNGKIVCTCGMEKKGCAAGDDWIKCPKHGRSIRPTGEVV